MAKKFGGKFSPKDNSGAPVSIWPDWRANILFFAPLPLVFRAFTGASGGLTMNLLAFGVLILAAWLTRDGVKAQASYDVRKSARRPAIPRKIFGAALTGIGLFIAGFSSAGPFGALGFGLLGTALHGFTFGPDPLRDKGMDGIDGYQNERVAKVVDAAEKHLAAMSAAIEDLNDHTLSDHLASFQTTARQMFRTVEDDPRDLTAARKYLGVYLQGAHDATLKFTDLYARTGDKAARNDYQTLLIDLQDSFAARTKNLLLDDRSDLDVEIEVLRERLERDGIPLKE